MLRSHHLAAHPAPRVIVAQSSRYLQGFVPSTSCRFLTGMRRHKTRHERRARWASRVGQHTALRRRSALKHDALHLLHRRTGFRYPNLIRVRLFEQQCLHDTARHQRASDVVSRPQNAAHQPSASDTLFTMVPHLLMGGSRSGTHGRRHSPAENMAAVPAVVLAHDDGEIGVTALAPEDGLIFDPPRPLFALLGLLELLQRPAQRDPAASEGACQQERTACAPCVPRSGGPRCPEALPRC